MLTLRPLCWGLLLFLVTIPSTYAQDRPNPDESRAGREGATPSYQRADTDSGSASDDERESTAGVQQQVARALPPPTVITPTRTGTRPPLVSSLTAPIAIERAIPPHESAEEIFLRTERSEPVVGESDGSLQSVAGLQAAPTIVVGFEGLDYTGYLPPDSDGSIGPNHYFEWINAELAIFNRSGTMVFGPSPGNIMFAGLGGPCQTTNDGDPVVLFDQIANRWFASQFAVTGGANSLCIAISQGANPTTSSWYLYEYNFGVVFPDYEKYGIWDSMYTLTFHGFEGSPLNYSGLRLGAFDRAAMLAGNPTAQLQFYNADVTFGAQLYGALPPRVQGPNNVAPGLPAPFVHLASNEAFGGTDRYSILELDVDFANPANTTLTKTDLAAAAFDQNLCNFNRNCIRQPATSVGLSAFGGNTLFQAPVRDLDLSAGLDLRLLAQGAVDANGADRAGIRWVELQNTGSGWSIRQQSTFAPSDSRSRWMGSIAMNGAGDIALGYSVSDATSTFPSIWATGRLASDPLGSMTLGEIVLRTGLGSQLSTFYRWGDYAVMDVDPNDDQTFWHINEYIRANGTWSTHISHFSLTSGPQTRYVATTGNNTGNSCTVPANPCATIAHAVAQANAGDTLQISAGTYIEPGLLITKQLNIQAQNVIVR